LLTIVNGYIFFCRKYLFDAENGLLQSIQESQPTGSVTSDIVVHQDASGALFTVENHFGAVMAIPQNTLQLWPGFEGPESTGIALLPQHNLVNFCFLCFIESQYTTYYCYFLSGHPQFTC